MKRKRTNDPMVLNDQTLAAEEPMLRTQIYLTRSEHEYLQAEASRRGEGMSSVIRSIIDEKMAIPADAWADNPLLEDTPEVAGWEGHRDGALNHDHYIYGSAEQSENQEVERVEQGSLGT